MCLSNDEFAQIFATVSAALFACTSRFLRGLMVKSYYVQTTVNKYGIPGQKHQDQSIYACKSVWSLFGKLSHYFIMNCQFCALHICIGTSISHTHTHTATCGHIPIHFHMQLFVVWLVRFHRKTWTSNDTNKNIMCAVHGVQLFLLSNKSNSGFRECFFVVMKRPNSCTVQYTRYRTLKTAHCTVTTFLSSTCKNDRMRLPECQTICDFAWAQSSHSYAMAINFNAYTYVKVAQLSTTWYFTTNTDIQCIKCERYREK